MPGRRRSASLSRVDTERRARMGNIRRNSVTAHSTGRTITFAQSVAPHADPHISMTPQEESVLLALAADGNVEQAVQSYLALPSDARTLYGVRTMLEAVLRSPAPLAPSSTPVPLHNVDTMYTLYQGIRAWDQPALDSKAYAIVIDALCRRDLEVVARSPEAAPHRVATDYLALALQVATQAHALKRVFDSTVPYNQLLQCCVPRGDTSTAVAVLALLESNLKTTKDAESYMLLLQIFMHQDVPQLPDETLEDKRVRCLQACQLIFTTFQRVATAKLLIEPQAPGFSREQCARVWACMFDVHFALGDPFGAVALFERMLGQAATDRSTPVLDEQVVSRMIMGFVRIGDVRSAVQWLHQLNASHLPAPHVAAYEGIVASAMQQTPAMAATLLRDTAQALTARDAPTCGMMLASSRCVMHLANVLEIRKVERQLSAQDLSSCYVALHTLAVRLFSTYSAERPLRTRQQALPVSAILRLAAHQSVAGQAEEAGALFALATMALRHADLSSPSSVSLIRDACHLPMAIADAALSSPHVLSDSCIRFLTLAMLVIPALRGMDCSLVDTANTALVREFEAASRDVQGNLALLSLDSSSWAGVVDAFLRAELASPRAFPGPDGHSGLGKLLTQLARIPNKPSLALEEIEARLREKYGEPGVQIAQGWMSGGTLNEEASIDSNTSAQTPAAPAPPTVPVADMDDLHMHGVLDPTLPPVKSIDASLSSTVQSLARPHGQFQADDLYERLRSSMEKGVYPTPSALAVLINAFGRNAQVEQIDELYRIGRHILASKPQSSDWCLHNWTQLEDGMITALSHAMLADRANAHRLRLIRAHQVPSASAYAALIATIQERTDDAVVAEELFQESQRLGVRPTTYLYNTVISKLSRARKVEQALRLFDEMRTANLRPSSVTYGAAINACVRTCDEARATQLFAEMESQPSFQPRVPPYNTMIQYYVHSALDREKALQYYEKMQQAGVRPSAHTYKLLLDVWGTIEPVQPDRQQAVFARLSADRLVGVQGTHWASLIQTQGVMLHDLDRALETFESIADRAPPSLPGRSGGSTVPDAVVYESLFAVFVAHGRTDLMPMYLARMVSQGILPTAYIANLLIKGYAQDGPLGLVEARRVFDAMIDPPAGVAAAGNHLPRHHGAGALGVRRERVSHRAGREQAVDRTNILGALVNREPSTYEAMIRAELAFGHTDRALAILEKMKARAFPAALLHRAQAMFDRAQP